MTEKDAKPQHNTILPKTNKLKATSKAIHGLCVRFTVCVSFTNKYHGSQNVNSNIYDYSFPLYARLRFKIIIQNEYQ